MKVLLLSLFIVALAGLSGCRKSQEADPGFFLRSTNVTVATKPGQGSGSNRITDLWYYINGQYIGAYPVGNLAPFAAKGLPCRINVFAGIRNNGMTNTRIPFQMYEPLTIDTLIPNGVHLERSFQFKYRDAVVFPWMEDFDSSVGFGMKRSDISDTTFKKASPDDAFEGTSIELGLSGNDMIAQIESSGDGFVLPSGNPQLYLEINYKSNIVFSVGLIDDQKQLREAIVFNPSDSWNKSYISLADPANISPLSTKYKLYIRVLKSDPSVTGRVFIDNLKIEYL